MTGICFSKYRTFNIKSSKSILFILMLILLLLKHENFKFISAEKDQPENEFIKKNEADNFNYNGEPNKSLASVKNNYFAEKNTQ